MNIGLDFDDTITSNITLWNKIIDLFKSEGYKVYIVTIRLDNSLNDDIHEFIRESNVDDVFFTGGLQKESYCRSKGIEIDIWIDDQPITIPKASSLSSMYKGCVNSGEV